MFADEYLMPGFQLVRQHQRILLHTLVFLVLGSLCLALGTLVGLIPIVAGFTLAGVPITSLSMDQLANFLSSNSSLLAGASVSAVLLVLNLFICLSFYFGGIINEVVDPKPQLITAVRMAFGSIRRTLKPLMFTAFTSLILGAAGVGAGWGVWSATSIWPLASVLLFLGIALSAMSFYLFSLTAIIANMESIGVVDAAKKSFAVVGKDPLNYLALLLLVSLANTIILLLPVFGVLITLITVPISFSSLIGYYYINKQKLEEAPGKFKPPQVAEAAPVVPAAPLPAQAPMQQANPQQAPAEKPAPAPSTPARPSSPSQPPASSPAPGNETDDARTKRILSKILKDL